MRSRRRLPADKTVQKHKALISNVSQIVSLKVGKLHQKSQLNRAIILVPRQDGCNSNDNHTKWTSVDDCELSNSGKLAGQAGEAVCTPACKVLVSKSRVSAFQEVRDTMITAAK